MKEALQYLLGKVRAFEFVGNPDDDIAAVASDASLQSLEKFRAQPQRIKSQAVLASSDSFCDYVNRFKAEETTIYLDVAHGRFKAVIDHHGKNAPQWCDHTALFEPKHSHEWVKWIRVHDKWLSQLEFACTIEELLHTIGEPEPADVLKAALEFQSNEKLAVASVQNLDNGTMQFHFQKDNVSKKVTFPHRIKLWLSIFDNEEKSFYEARIRYRVDNEGVLKFKFSFVQLPDILLRNALLDLSGKITDATEGLVNYEGSLGR